MITAADVLKQLNDPRIVFNAAEVRAIYDAYKNRDDRLSRTAVMNFAIGDRVYFNSKQGRKNGVIERINAKTIGVLVTETRPALCPPNASKPFTTIDYPVHWKVSPSVLIKEA